MDGSYIDLKVRKFPIIKKSLQVIDPVNPVQSIILFYIMTENQSMGKV